MGGKVGAERQQKSVCLLSLVLCVLCNNMDLKLDFGIFLFFLFHLTTVESPCLKQLCSAVCGNNPERGLQTHNTGTVTVTQCVID